MLEISNWLPKILLLDSFHGDIHAQTQPHGVNGRLAIGVAYRLPNGRSGTYQTTLTEIGTGMHEAALGLRGYLDLLVGDHFWTSFVTRYDNEMGSDMTTRIADSANPLFVPLYRRTTVHRTLGNLLEIETAPSVGGQ